MTPILFPKSWGGLSGDHHQWLWHLPKTLPARLFQDGTSVEKNSGWSFPRPAKTRWGRKIAASSFVSLEVLGSIQLTDTWKGSGMVMFLQNLCMICLCTLPFWDPQSPVLAKATNSTWSALSCKAKSASSLTSMALSYGTEQANLKSPDCIFQGLPHKKKLKNNSRAISNLQTAFFKACLL